MNYIPNFRSTCFFVVYLNARTLDPCSQLLSDGRYCKLQHFLKNIDSFPIFQMKIQILEQFFQQQCVWSGTSSSSLCDSKTSTNRIWHQRCQRQDWGWGPSSVLICLSLSPTNPSSDPPSINYPKQAWRGLCQWQAEPGRAGPQLCLWGRARASARSETSEMSPRAAITACVDSTNDSFFVPQRWWTEGPCSERRCSHWCLSSPWASFGPLLPRSCADDKWAAQSHRVTCFYGFSLLSLSRYVMFGVLFQREAPLEEVSTKKRRRRRL